MLINLSNHPSAKWSAEQAEAARRLFGEVVDLPFPVVDPAGDEDHIASLTDEYFRRILEIAEEQHVTVHLMGEMTLTYALVQRLHAHGIPCVASTTKRETIDYADGRRESLFKFVQFRKYSSSN